MFAQMLRQLKKLEQLDKNWSIKSTFAYYTDLLLDLY